MSLIHWWPLNGDLLDRVGNNSLQYINSSGKIVTNNSGKLGKCYERTAVGSADLLRSKETMKVFTEESICAWIYVSQHAALKTANGVVTNHDHTTNSGLGIGVYSSDGTNYYVSINAGNGSSRIHSTYWGQTNIKGAWHHVCLVSNGSTIRMYVDGKEDRAAISYNVYSKADYLDIFNWSTGYYIQTSYRPACKVCDVRVYDHALSVKEVKELSKALMVHYTFNDVANEVTTNIIYDKYKGYSSSLTKLTETFNGMEIYKNVVTSPYTGSAKDNAGFCHKAAFPYTQEQAKQPYFQLSFWKRLNQSYGVNIGGYIKVRYTDETTGQHSWSYSKSNWGTDINSIGKWEYITARATLFTGKTVKEIISFYVYGRNATGGDCDFAGIQLEAKDHPTPYVEGSRTGLLFNEAGYDEPISFQNLELTSNTISGSYAGIFDSSKPTQIRTALDLSGDTDVSIACWLYPQNGTTAFTDNALYCVISGTALSLYAYGRSNSWLDCGSCLTLDAWNHVVVIYSATERIVYVNGKEVKRGAVSNSFDKRSSLDIGYGSTTTRAFNGKIADFRIYKTPLSADDVLELYESQAAIDKNQNIFTNEIIEQNNSNMTNANSWETGAINDASGTENNQSNLLSTRIRSKYIPVLPNTKYYFAVKEKCKVRQIYYYTKDLAFIGIVDGGEQTTPPDCYFVRWVLKPKNDSDTIDVKDIALYEPSMTPCNMNVIPSFGINTDVQVTKAYQLKTKDICENHDVGFFKDGTTSGNNFYEI